MSHRITLITAARAEGPLLASISLTSCATTVIKTGTEIPGGGGGGWGGGGCSGMGGAGGRGSYICNARRLVDYQNEFRIKMGSDASHFIVSFMVQGKAKVARQCP